MSIVERVAPPRRPDPVDVDTKPPHRKWRYILVASVLAVVLLAGGIVFWWVATRFDPIRLNTGGPSRIRLESGLPTRVPAVEPSTDRPLTAFLVDYRDGQWLDMGIFVYNYSPFVVTVEDIGFHAPDVEPLRQESVSMESADVPDKMIEFRPFTLGADKGRYVVIRYRFSGCSQDSSDESVIATRQRIQFTMRVGWITIHRSELIPMRYSVAVQRHEGCP